MAPPSQHNQTSNEATRYAVAPYNFVPLPSKVLTVDSSTFAKPFGAYDEERHTGYIDCTLTAEAPLYVRGGLTVDEVRQKLQAKDLPGFFAAARAPDAQGLPRPVIPGSSLRGMLRSLVEIVAYAKVGRVTDRQRYYFRAVAAKADDPLALPYRAQLRNVRAGYLVRLAEGWAIRPAQLFGAEGYLKVREQYVPPHLGLIRLSDRRYRPQYIPVSFTTKTTPKGRLVVDRIDKPSIHEYRGTMVTSGNMLETGGGRARGISPRKNHAVVGEPDENAQLLPIDPHAVEDYRASLTDFQRGDGMGEDGPFHPLEGIFAHHDGRPAEGRPVFYCEPQKGQPVIFFGQSPNFRVPYRFLNSTRAATPRDFVPGALRDDGVVDLAEAIFGFVRGERQREGQAQAGRVFVSDAAAEAYEWLAEEPIVPRILATPKPTTFQHYLVQTSGEKRQLRHYASRPGDETVIRGNKLYWHKGSPTRAELEDGEFLQEPPDKQVQDTQHTRIRPVSAGSRFRFQVRFENLSDVELGALLWVLRLSDDARHGGRQYRLKLGMGKPLGMGAVRIEHDVFVSQRARRYTSLFGADGGWELAEGQLAPVRADACADAFERFVLGGIDERERPPESGRLADVLRIQMLLALLSWPGPQPTEQYSRYMEIERNRPRIGQDKNEYKDRPVLPSPLQVLALAQGQPLPEQTPEPSLPSEPSRDRAPATSKPRGPVLPEVGAVFTGRILELDDSSAVLEVPGFAADKALALLGDLGGKRFRVGNAARVEVTKVRTKGILTILDVRIAPPRTQEA